MFLRLKLYVVFLLAKIAEKIADCVSFEEIIVCYLSFLLYIMILWFSFLSPQRTQRAQRNKYAVNGFHFIKPNPPCPLCPLW